MKYILMLIYSFTPRNRKDSEGDFMKRILSCTTFIIVAITVVLLVTVGLLLFRSCDEPPTPTVTSTICTLEPTKTLVPTTVTVTVTVDPTVTPTSTPTVTPTKYIPIETDPPWITAQPTEYKYRPAPAMQLEKNSKRKLPKGW